MDIGHVVNCLNKLDAGTPEKTLLTSRNQDSLLIVRSEYVSFFVFFNIGIILAIKNSTDV